MGCSISGREWTRVSAAALAALACATLAPSGSDAKTPGAVHCHKSVCHRVLTIEETRRRVGLTLPVRASYYRGCDKDRFNACGLTSSGEVFRPDRPDNAASPIFPDGTTLLVFNPANGNAAVVRVNNAGPYHAQRTLDLSAATAERLGFTTLGVADLEVRVLKAPRAHEAVHRRLRHYVPVAGDIGRHASLEAAQASLSDVHARRLADSATPAQPPVLSAEEPVQLAIVHEPATVARAPTLHTAVSMAPSEATIARDAPPSRFARAIQLQAIVAQEQSSLADWIDRVANRARIAAQTGIRPDPSGGLPVSAIPQPGEMLTRAWRALGHLAAEARRAARANVVALVSARATSAAAGGHASAAASGSSGTRSLW